MISIVIPVYNFADEADKIILELVNWSKKYFNDIEIIFVNDGSTDKTADKIEQYIGSGKIKLINFTENMGKGAAVKAGIMQSVGDYIIFTDADLPYGLEVIDKFKEKFVAGYEVILGKRILTELQLNTYYEIKRRILSYIFLKSANLILLNKINDTQCGIKGFSKQAVKDIFSKVETSKFSFDVEVIYLAQKLDYKIIQVPVVLLNNEISTMKPFKDGLMMFVDLVKLYFRNKIRKIK